MRTMLLLLMLGVAWAAQADSFIGGQVTPSATEPTCDNVTPRLVPCVAPKEVWPQGEVVLVPKLLKDQQATVPVAPLKPGTVRIHNSTITVPPNVSVNTGVEVR